MSHTAYRVARGIGWITLVLVATLAVAPANQVGPDRAGDARPAALERGKYLVHDVAMCVQCHSPRSANGELNEHTLLHGGRVAVTSPYPDLPWAFMAPRLAGIPGWDPDDLTTLLQTGRRRDGSSPRPPMPPFRMHEDDARAVVAYLSSLSP